MKIYWSEANREDVLDFGDEEMFRVGDTYYYNAVEHGTNPGGIEEVRIYDTCNRSIPVSIENIPELVEALNHCYNNYQQLQRMARLDEALNTNAKFVVTTNGDWCSVEQA